MRMKCSIVIPVYNVRDYLRDCLDSCLRQELEGLEIVCVDDGSTDGSADILSEYARRDSRVRIVTFGTNRGLYQARKCGVEAATGEYLLHLDSDDLLEGANGLQRLVAAADADHVDLLQFGARAFMTAAADAVGSDGWPTFAKALGAGRRRIVGGQASGERDDQVMG